MKIKNLFRVAAVGAMLAVSSGAADAKGTPQTHHCQLPDGSMDMQKTKKQCLAAKGTWAKDAAASATPAAAATPASPAPAAAAPAPAPAPAPKN